MRATVLKAAVVGGVLTVALDVIPGVSCCTTLCGLAGWIGGLLACYLAARDPEGLDLLEALWIGLLSGLVASVFRPSMLGDARTPDGRSGGYALILKSLLVAAVPLALTVGTFGTAWDVVGFSYHQATTYQSVQIPAGHRPIELDVVGGTFMPPASSSAT